MRVLILCAGEGSRWNNYTGVPKHKVLIEGEILIERTVRQFLEYTDDIVIVSNGDLDIPGTSSYTAKIEESHKDMAKFLSSHEQWSDTKTIIVYGDVYFTDEAVKTIATNDRPICFYLRESASKITGKPWGEIFGFSFDASFNNSMLENLNNILLKRIIKDISPPAGWTLLRYILNVKRTTEIFRPKNGYIYINIDDWTDDFDYPEDLHAWHTNRKLFI